MIKQALIYRIFQAKWYWLIYDTSTQETYEEQIQVSVCDALKELEVTYGSGYAWREEVKGSKLVFDRVYLPS